MKKEVNENDIYEKNIYEKLTAIQNELKVPKNLFNKFGGYAYRNAEQICESAKPILEKYACNLTISDDIIAVGNRIYVQAIATLVNAENTDEFIVVKAMAREEETKKGMDGSQITGSASSYARKYALNGLFCIDDTKESDTTNDTANGRDVSEPLNKVASAKDMDTLVSVWNEYSELHSNSQFVSAVAKRKGELK